MHLIACICYLLCGLWYVKLHWYIAYSFQGTTESVCNSIVMCICGRYIFIHTHVCCIEGFYYIVVY